MNTFKIFYPLKPYILTQQFGENLTPLYKEMGMLGHNGWDMVGSTGQMIRAAHDGIVTFTGEDGSGGLGVVVRAEEEFEYKDGTAYFKTIYWHCLPGSFKVKPGDKVKVGDELAECDTTGKANGAHLHFGLKPIQQGEEDWQWFNIEQSAGYFGAIDPAPYWNGEYAEDIGNLEKQVSLLTKVVELLKTLLGIKNAS